MGTPSHSPTWPYPKSTKQWAPHHTRQPGHTPFMNPQPHRIHRPSQAVAFFLLVTRNWQSSSRVPETHGPPIIMVNAFILAHGPRIRASCMPHGSHSSREHEAPSGSVHTFVLAGSRQARPGAVLRGSLLLDMGCSSSVHAFVLEERPIAEPVRYLLIDNYCAA